MKTVAIIEDEIALCEVLSVLFERRGYHVLVTNDGESGLACVEKERPDLVILDLGLPKISGEAVCRELKDSDDEQLSHIPIIVLTARDTDTDRVVIKAMGADIFMAKPFMLNDLMDQVTKLLPAA